MIKTKGGLWLVAGDAGCRLQTAGCYKSCKGTARFSNNRQLCRPVDVVDMMWSVVENRLQ
jgi:uncharacterized Fe-S cluster-containing radical SAM superfamily protein